MIIIDPNAGKHVHRLEMHKFLNFCAAHLPVDMVDRL